MSKGRRKHSPAFKAKVAVEVVKGHAHPSAVVCEPFAQAEAFAAASILLPICLADSPKTGVLGPVFLLQE